MARWLRGSAALPLWISVPEWQVTTVYNCTSSSPVHSSGLYGHQTHTWFTVLCRSLCGCLRLELLYLFFLDFSKIGVLCIRPLTCFVKGERYESLVFFLCGWISCYHSVISWKYCHISEVYFWHLCQKLDDWTWGDTQTSILAPVDHIGFWQYKAGCLSSPLHSLSQICCHLHLSLPSYLLRLPPRAISHHGTETG